MSAIRKVSNKGTIPDEEVEVEASKDKDSPNTSAAFAATSASDSFSPPSAGRNPVFLAKAIFRKVFALLTQDEEGVTQMGGIVGLLKDIIIGTIWGIVGVSILLFLDRLDVIHIDSAHDFRDAAFQTLTDPEIIANLVEEATDFKLMTVADYESQREELDVLASIVERRWHDKTISQRTKAGEGIQKELDAIRDEYDALANNELLGLKYYCGGCSWDPWDGGTTCDARVQFLHDKHHIWPIRGKVMAMEAPSCKKKQ